MEAEVGTFALRNANAVRITFRSENGWYIASANPIPVVPLRVALIAGDGLNNVRTALDHLIWQLVLREDEKPQQANCFPIFETPSEFAERVTTPAQRGKRNPLSGIPVNGDAWTIIEKAQPFNGPELQEDNPLLLLANLTNFDKHRTLLVQQSWFDPQRLSDNFRWEPEFEPIEKRFTVAPLSSEHPTEVRHYAK